MKTPEVLLALIAGLVLGIRAGADELELYRARARPAAELAALIGPLLAPEGSAIADDSGGIVLLRGPAEIVAQALETLRTLDVAPRQYRIETELASQTVLAARGWEVEGWIRLGDLWMGRAATGSVGAELDAHQLRAGSGRQFQASIVALEGQPAEIWTGNLFPFSFTQYEVEGRHRRHRDVRALETTVWMPVRQGLRVRARSAGNAVELDLVPVVEDGHPETGIRELGASTRVRVKPGEPLVIGSIDRSSSVERADPLARQGLAETSGELLLVTVETLD